MKSVGSAKFRHTFLDLARDGEPIEVTHLGNVVAFYTPVGKVTHHTGERPVSRSARHAIPATPSISSHGGIERDAVGVSGNHAGRSGTPE